MSSAAMKLAMTFTAIDAASSIVLGLEKRVLRLGDAGKQVKKDFDDMVSHARAGFKALASEKYLFDKLKPGVSAAADVQEAMIDVRMTLQKAGDDAGVLSDKLKQVRDNAYGIQKWAIGGTTDVLKVTNVLVKPIKEMESIIGPKGAVAATMALATITKEAPEMVAHAMTDIAIPFKLRGPQFGELADWMQRLVTSSNTNVLELMEGMKYAAPPAGQQGLGWKDTLIGMGVLAEHGLRGSVAGTGLKDFIVRLTGAFRSGEDWIKVLNLRFYEGFDERGNLKNLSEIIQEMREKIGGMAEEQQGTAITDLMGLKGKERKQMLDKLKKNRELAQLKALSPKERTEALVKIWGMEGMPPAAALMDTGIGSYEYVLKNATESLPLEEKINMRMGGLKATLEGMQGTWQSTLANVFDPMLGTLRAIANAGNDAADAINTFAEANKKITAGFNIGIGAAAVGIAGYGAFRLAKAGLSARKVFRALGSTAAGVVEGKALQMAAGVVPVYVVNMPSSLALGGGSNVPTTQPKGTGTGSGPVLYDANGRPVATGGPGGAPSAAARGTGGIGSAIGKAAALLGYGYVVDDAVSGMHHDLLNLYSGTRAVLGGAESWREFARQQQAEIKNDVRISIHIDPDRRVTTQTSDLNTTARIDLNRGELMGNMSN